MYIVKRISFFIALVLAFSQVHAKPVSPYNSAGQYFSTFVISTQVETWNNVKGKSPYGRMCERPLFIKVEIKSSTKVSISWRKMYGDKAYRVAYRKKGGDGQWNYIETTKNHVTIKNLNPLNTYEYMVQGLCGDKESFYSNVHDFTMPAKASFLKSCSSENVVPPLHSSARPLKYLYTGDVITVGDCKAIVLEASGTKGVFSGKCIVYVEGADAFIKAHFNNIYVNNKYKITAGRIVADRAPDNVVNKYHNIAPVIERLADVNLDSLNMLNYVRSMEMLSLLLDKQVVSENPGLNRSIKKIVDNLNIIKDRMDQQKRKSK